MEPGLRVDPATGRPLSRVTSEGERTRAAAEEALLKEQAAFYKISESEAGKQLKALLENKLLSRIEALLKADPEAGAYLSILKGMGYREDAAKRALSKLSRQSGLSGGKAREGAGDMP